MGGIGKRRRIGVRLAAVALAGASVVAVAPTAGAVDLAGTEAERRARVEGQQELRELVEHGGMTAALAEIRIGRSTWRGAVGVAELGSGRPARADGRFRIGSVTKTFVATVVLQLAGERRLRLDDPVERYLPGVVPNGAAITVRQLLNHTSGLYNFTEDDRFLVNDEAELEDYAYGRWRYQDHRARQLVAVAAEHAPYFPPGQGWKYSNTNYVLAGMIIQKVTGRSWQRETERRIVEPLGLHDTLFPTSQTGLGGPSAHAYLAMPAGPADITRFNPSVVDSAGNGISTTADLNRFHAALFGGKLLRPAQMADLTTTVPTGTPGGSYGLGVLRIDLGPSCEPAWGHDGGLPGWSTLLLGSRDGKRQFALSHNPFVGTDDSASGPAIGSLIVKTLCDEQRPAARGTAPWTPPSTGPDLLVTPR
ncbi:serine hydrolase domain-containing protein [Kitasatospora sp. NPDC096147]|uniref:serine hydrolase domain-containing protein n=1 Tax=Kitasatospora sp. NPDC096147 TaxID=3364093 RepID=UPI003808983E